jgi:hypothetical protein
MGHRAISSIREIVRLTFIGTLALFLVAETVLEQDVIFVHPVAVLAFSGVAAILWYRGLDRRVS